MKWIWAGVAGAAFGVAIFVTLSTHPLVGAALAAICLALIGPVGGSNGSNIADHTDETTCGRN